MDEKDLARCPICVGMNPDQRRAFIENLKYTIRQFKKGEFIARQGDTVSSLYILLKGCVGTEMINESGQLMRIEKLKAPSPLAPAFLFAQRNKFPVDVVAEEDCEVLIIPKEEVMRQLALNEAFMRSFLEFNSGRMQFMTDKLQLMSIKTIKGKLAYYLLSIIPDGEFIVELELNQTQLADYFCVARPSLARTLSEMEDEGLIKTDRRKVEILDRSGLRQLL